MHKVFAFCPQMVPHPIYKDYVIFLFFYLSLDITCPCQNPPFRMSAASQSSWNYRAWLTLYSTHDIFQFSLRTRKGIAHKQETSDTILSTDTPSELLPPKSDQF